MRLVFVCLLLAEYAFVTDSKRVVVVPMPNVSHTRYLTNVARGLIALGHEAWICMPYSVAQQDVFNTTGIHVVTYSNQHVNVVDDYMKYVRDAYWNDQKVDLKKMTDILFNHVETMMEDKHLEASIRDINADLMIIDNLPNLHMISVLAYKLDLPFAFVGSLYDPVHHRVPFTTATFPSCLFSFTQHMTFPQRLISFAIQSIMVMFDMFSYTDAVSRFAPEKPYLPVRELVARAEIVLVESDPVLDYPKVSLPNVKLIGGTAVSHAMPLEEPFKSFVDTAKNGVVVVSFGSYIVDFPRPIAAKLMAAFRRLPLRVIWRINMPSPDPSHILTSTWIPQNDLIGHQNVKLLVTHCGQSSQYEALFHGVPTLCMPIFLDQPYNAERARSKGYGLTLDLKTSSEDEIVSHILQLHTESYYTDNIKKASKLFKINYGLPMEQAAFWLDHILQYGGSYMRYAGQTMPGYQFYCLDILAVCLLALVLACACAAFAFKKCFRGLIVIACFVRLRTKIYWS